MLRKKTSFIMFTAWLACAEVCTSLNCIADEPRSDFEHSIPTQNNRPPITYDESTGSVRFSIFDEPASETQHFLREASPIYQASLLQPTPFVAPRVELNSQSPSAGLGSTPSSTPTLASRVFSEGAVERSILGQARAQINTLGLDYVRGSEAGPTVSTDVGSLLRKSPAAMSVDVQRRSPIVNDTRIRSSRIGALAASGSHWVPARADLDTVLSKIDSRVVEDVLIIPGPYSSLYGPSFNTVDFQLLTSPRSERGDSWDGRSSFDHNSNGNQWLGQQAIWGGGENWGARVNYVHRYGDDYRAGDGSRVAAGYESREWTIALGYDLNRDESIEVSILRLDQTDVDFPGYVFDMDFLVTDAYSIAYTNDDSMLADRSETEIWYNHTRFEGDAQGPAKRQLFPLLDRLDYIGTTDVESMSTGYRQAYQWGQQADYRFTVGHDLRYIKQELNEIADATTLGVPVNVNDRNSPIPKSFSVNPGLFTEYEEQFLEDFTFRTGGRLDYVQTDVIDDFDKLQTLGLGQFPATYAEIVGTDRIQTDRFLWSLYTALDRRFGEGFVGTAAIGFAQRPPNLTELYAAQPFLVLLQNGLNNVTGDPDLDAEQMIQADLSLDYQGENIRYGFRGFHGWALDYITLENTGLVFGPPNNQAQQVSLRYVNTDLATFVGGEAFVELYPTRRLSPFLIVKGVDGRDRTRNGDFATRNGEAGTPSEKFAGLSRGFFSGVAGGSSEPLPGISPFEMRTGVRLRDISEQPEWNIELSARIVARQDRVATSLLESETPGFTTFDVRGTYSPLQAPGLTIVSGIENFTDEAYREHLDFRSPSGIQILQPGINFYVGADWIY